MGTFYAKCKIENPVDRTRSAILPKLLVDTGSEFTRVPERTLERIGIVGFAIIRLDKHFTIDEVVFGEPGDPTLLGARTLEGLNSSNRPAGDVWHSGHFPRGRRPVHV